ncbi:rna polymerase iii rpc4 [Cystoisospora suis]|uniref:Rna polymerase iii rpc4 n=1 Tax=Cystoisospora suis TaxID=483139 RepID=A0A2C6KNE4_9APIC|nr:rna polymerase iii rpc4 [Cystoisospora suis]
MRRGRHSGRSVPSQEGASEGPAETRSALGSLAVCNSDDTIGGSSTAGVYSGNLLAAASRTGQENRSSLHPACQKKLSVPCEGVSGAPVTSPPTAAETSLSLATTSPSSTLESSVLSSSISWSSSPTRSLASPLPAPCYTRDGVPSVPEELTPLPLALGTDRSSSRRSMTTAHPGGGACETGHSDVEAPAFDGCAVGFTETCTADLHANADVGRSSSRHQSLLEGIANLRKPAPENTSASGVILSSSSSSHLSLPGGTGSSRRWKRLRKAAEEEAKSEGETQGEPQETKDALSGVQPTSLVDTSSPEGPGTPSSPLVASWPSSAEARLLASLPASYTAPTSLRPSELSAAGRLMNPRWPLFVRRPASGSQSTCLPASSLPSSAAARFFPQLHASGLSERTGPCLRTPALGDSFSCQAHRSALRRSVPVRFTPNLSRCVASAAPSRSAKKEDTSSRQGDGRRGLLFSGSEHRTVSEQRLPLLWSQTQGARKREEVKDIIGDSCAARTKKEEGAVRASEEKTCEGGSFTGRILRRQVSGGHFEAGRGGMVDGTLGTKDGKARGLGRRAREHDGVCGGFGLRKTVGQRKKAEVENSELPDAEHGVWKREAAEGFDSGITVDDGYPPMCLPLRKHPFRPCTPAAALTATDASSLLRPGCQGLSAATSPGFASLVLLQLPRCLPAIDKERMRHRREQRKRETNCPAQSGPDGSKTVNAGTDTATQTDRAATRASPSEAGGARSSSFGLDPDPGRKASLSCLAGDSMSLNELPDGALGRLLLLKSGRVIWCLGSERESEEERERRRAEQIRKYPVCPWEKPEGEGKASSMEEKRRRRKVKSQQMADGVQGAVIDRQDQPVKTRESAQIGQSPRRRLRHLSGRKTKDHKQDAAEGAGLVNSSLVATAVASLGKPKTAKRVVESSESETERRHGGKVEEQARAAGLSTREGGERQGDITLAGDGSPAASEFSPSPKGRERETRAGDFFFRVDVGCDCIFKQECAVMLHDNKEFVLFGKPSLAAASLRLCLSGMGSPIQMKSRHSFRGLST